jgi:signal transduction histidine kinase
VARATPRTSETDQERLARIERTHHEFLAMVAHELRDPMTSCIGFAEMLARKGDRMSEAERTEALEAIAKTGRRIVDLLEDILDVARLEGGSLPYVMQSTDLNDVVQGVLTEQQALARNGDIRFVPGAGAVVEADRDRLHQVVLNLLSNAVKFSPDGARVEITTHVEDGTAIVSVADQGIGIDPKDLPLLFGRFARITQPGVTERIPGTGLGLYISKSIVDAHRGELSVDSAPGRGSTFRVALPLARSAS